MKDTVSLKVLGFLEAEVVHESSVRVKLTGKLGKLKKVCSKRMGVQLSRLRFRFKSHSINDEDTPETLKMKDGDIIEVFTFNTVHKADIEMSDTNEYILLKVVDIYDPIPDRKIHFKVKFTTQLGELKKTWSQRMGLQLSSLRFVFQSHSINDDDTPHTLQMKDGDIIEVFLDGSVAIEVKDWNNKVIYFKVKLTTQLGKLKNSWSERMGIQLSRLRFVFQSKHINDDDTPETLKMKDGDIIEVYMSPR